jgi:hypothetical protein
MSGLSSFTAFKKELRQFMERSTDPDWSGADGEDEFRRLAIILFRLQFDNVEFYRRYCEARGVNPGNIEQWDEIPALPIRAFKETVISSLPEEDRPFHFLSSGTTRQARSKNFHNAESLALYEASLVHWFKPHLAPEELPQPSRVLALTPSPEEAPHSSLVHMFGTVGPILGEFHFCARDLEERGWLIDYFKVIKLLEKCLLEQRPVLLLGTAFSFVQFLDFIGEFDMEFSLPKGSRLLETGGYKGRTREMAKAELYYLMTAKLGIPASHIVGEYGMSELSSQAYDHVAGQTGASNFQFPPWVRVKLLSPETGRDCPPGKPGLLRVYDLANTRSVLAVQTEDLAISRPGGFELVGRAAAAELRGCSLMALE